MKQQNNNYWPGFALGAVGGASLMYILGTKKGRKLLKEFLDNTEEFEHSVEDIMGYINGLLPHQAGEETPGMDLDGIMSKIKKIKPGKK